MILKEVPPRKVRWPWVVVLILVAYMLFGAMGTVLATQSSERMPELLRRTFTSGASSGGCATDIRKIRKGRILKGYALQDMAVQLFGASVEMKVRVDFQDGTSSQLIVKSNGRDCLNVQEVTRS